MRRFFTVSLMFLAAIGLQTSANAAIATLTGTVTSLSINTSSTNPAFGGPEIVIFSLSTPIPVTPTGCNWHGHYLFAFSPSSVNDANTRRDMLAVLLTAKAAGLSIFIAYDDAGAYCDASGYTAPTDIAFAN